MFYFILVVTIMCWIFWAVRSRYILKGRSLPEFPPHPQLHPVGDKKEYSSGRNCMKWSLLSCESISMNEEFVYSPAQWTFKMSYCWGWAIGACSRNRDLYTLVFIVDRFKHNGDGGGVSWNDIMAEVFFRGSECHKSVRKCLRCSINSQKCHYCPHMEGFCAFYKE